MNNLKRFTVCKVLNHDYLRISYPPVGEEAAGYFLRCKRCGKETHDAGAVARGAGGMV